AVQAVEREPHGPGREASLRVEVDDDAQATGEHADGPGAGVDRGPGDGGAQREGRAAVPLGAEPVGADRRAADAAERLREGERVEGAIPAAPRLVQRVPPDSGVALETWSRASWSLSPRSAEGSR